MNESYELCRFKIGRRTYEVRGDAGDSRMSIYQNRQLMGVICRWWSQDSFESQMVKVREKAQRIIDFADAMLEDAELRARVFERSCDAAEKMSGAQSAHYQLLHDLETGFTREVLK